MSEKSISREELNEIIEGYIEENPVPEDEPVPEQAKIAIRMISARALGAVILFSDALYKIAWMLSNDLKKEVASTEADPDRGFAWECFRQSIWLFSFGILATVTYVTLQLIPESPPNPTLEYIIENFLWGYYLLISLIQSVRYIFHEFRRDRDRDSNSDPA